MAEQGSDCGETGLLPDGNAGVVVPEVVDADAFEANVATDGHPEAADADRAASRPLGREDRTRSRRQNPLEDGTGMGGKVDRLRPGLRIGQVEVTIAVVLPMEVCDLTLPAAGKQDQPEHCDPQRVGRLPFGKGGPDARHLVPREHALLLRAPIAAQAGDRVASGRPGLDFLGLAHDHRKQGGRAVRRPRLVMESREPLLDIGPGDRADGPAFEVGQDGALEESAVGLRRARLPLERHPLDSRFSYHLEGCLGARTLEGAEHVDPLPDVGASLLQGHGFDVPESLVVVDTVSVDVEDEPLESGLVYAKAETFTLPVANDIGFPSWFRVANQSWG